MNITKLNILMHCVIIRSHSLRWRHCFADGRCLFKQPQSVYNIGISMTRIFQKSVGPSVCLSVCNANKKKAYSSSIINRRKIIRISGEWVWHPLQENEAIFKKKIQKFLSYISKKFCTCIKCLLLLHYKQ